MASTFDLADKVLKGKLAERLAEDRADGKTFDQIAADLRDKGIDVSRETVRRWVQKLDGIDPEVQVA